MRFWPPKAGAIYRESARAESQGQRLRAIAVASGKGGVGKTSLSVNLSLVLAMEGNRVVLFDADLGLANAEVLLGLVPRYTIHEVLYGDKTIDEVVTEGPCGLKVVSGGSGFLELANLDQARRQRLLAMLNSFGGQVDYLIIDTGAGINKNVLGFVAAAGEVIIVVTPDPTSLTDAYALIKILATFKVHTQVYLVVNRAADHRDAVRTFRRIQAAAVQFLDIRLNYLGSILEDRAVAQAVRSQQPFVLTDPRSRPSRNIAGIARFLTAGVRPEKTEGFWGKLIGLFG